MKLKLIFGEDLLQLNADVNTFLESYTAKWKPEFTQCEGILVFSIFYEENTINKSEKSSLRNANIIKPPTEVKVKKPKIKKLPLFEGEVSPEETGLLRDLLEWKQGKNMYYTKECTYGMIAHYAFSGDIIEAEDLAKITGIGPTIIDVYGESIINVIREHVEVEEL